MELEKLFLNYINDHDGVDSIFGKLEFTKSDRIGQGGNGLVYLARINDNEVAIKFLLSDDERKITRFKAEYLNINYVKSKLRNIVNMIHYDEVEIQEGLLIPYIVMSRYSNNLKKYREEKGEITEADFINLLNFLFGTLNSIHEKGIIHRDIKPENILVDGSEFVFTDFGIAHFNKADFPIDSKTRKGERLANIEFSAPEQINHQYEVTQASDIYSMAQIMYWYAFGTVNRGTGAEYISQKYDWKDACIYDSIINKCLRNNPAERFQSINEIREFYQTEKIKLKEIDPFEDMIKFHDAILSVVPECYNQPFFIDDKTEICQLFNAIFERSYDKSIWFNTGIGNSEISSICEIENHSFLMDWRELNIQCVWGFLTADLYDDILLIEVGESAPYEIGGEEYWGVAVIENDEMVPIDEIEGGYVRYKGSVHKTSSLNIQERYIRNEYKKIAIGPSSNCTIYSRNDVFLEALQKKDKLKSEDLFELKNQIHMNRPNEVTDRL